MEMMERDRALESFQAGDLEPGYNAKYNLLQEILRAMLKTPHVGSTDWIFFIAEILYCLTFAAITTTTSKIRDIPGHTASSSKTLFKHLL
ncbi:hypothetical protein BFJ70_g1548 [Fusarium oxysporum]|nr:hypothetical protein BFJ70_g1548 [Fusarium oxysporum]